MDKDLVPPKPTKEFHEAYAEIYGKKNKEEKKKGRTFVELPSLELPEVPTVPLPSEDKKSKTGFLSKFFTTREEKEASALEQLDMPPQKQVSLFPEEHEELPELPKDLKLKPLTFIGGKQKPLISLEELDMPPPKKEENAREKELKLVATPQRKVNAHDFLAEIKFGERKVGTMEVEIETKEEGPKEKKPFFSIFQRKKKEATPEMQEMKKEREEQVLFPEKEGLEKEISALRAKPTTLVFDEHKESVFEKEKLQKGARDLQSVYEKQHPHEMGGFEYLEKITPPKKPKSLKEPTPLREESWLVKEKLPKVRKQDLKTIAEVKNQLQLLKDVEKRLGQKVSELKQKQKQAQLWKARLEKQEQQVKEKLRKMAVMERGIKEKRAEVQTYEPQLAELHRQQDRLLEKEREIQHRQEDVHETEKHLRKEETTIVERIRDLESDQQLLEKEQNSIVETVEKLQKEREALNAKAKEFKEIMKKIEEAERIVKRKAELLDDRELMIKRKEEKMQKEVARVEKLKRSAEKLKDAEEAYERMKHRLREMYKEYEYRFTNQPARPEPVIKPMPLEPTFLRGEAKEVPALLRGDITSLITATKQLIMEKHYDDANRNVNVLMSRYMQIPDNNPRKKEIYYEILALKNMLKLELLE